MNEISVFNFQNRNVRVVTDDNGEPWFVAKDVAEILEYSDTQAMTRRLDVDDLSTCTDKTSGQVRRITTINESGLYNAIIGSNKPEAKAFKRWVTHEVLPSIRKHGAYVTDNKLEEWLTDPTHMIEALTALKEEREKVRALERKREEDRPKVVFAESVEVSQTSILVGEMAKLIKQSTGYDIGQNRFFEFLRDNGYLHCTGSQKNLPTQRSIASGWFEIKEGVHVSQNGVSILTRTPKITGKGQIYFINLFHKIAEEKAS